MLDTREAIARECPGLCIEAERANWAFGTAVAYAAIAVCSEQRKRLLPLLGDLSRRETQPSRRGALALSRFLLGEREGSPLADVDRAMTERYDSEEYGPVLEAVGAGRQTALDWTADDLLEILFSRGLFGEPSAS